MEPYLGEIRMFGGNFAPMDWALCDGQLLNITQYEALFTLVGTTYGGDGQITFALPDLRGRLPLHAGRGPGLSSRVLGAIGGTETVTLTAAQLPAHTHPVRAAAATATSVNPGGGASAGGPNGPYYSGSANTVAMHGAAVSAVGSNQPHDNVAPFTAVTYIIALAGIYPSQA
jgi:microcystin-dependent protein